MTSVVRAVVEDPGDSAGGLILPEEDPEFESLLEHAQRTPDGGWLVEGDMHFVNTQHLYETFIGARAAAEDPNERDEDKIEPRSTVACSEDSFDGTWDIHEKLRITYCLGAFSDLELRTNVFRGLRYGLRQIERTTDLNYVLIPTDSPEECEAAWISGEVFYIVRQGIVCDGELDPTEGGNPFPNCDCIVTPDKDCDIFGRGTFPASNGKLVFFDGMNDKPNSIGGPQSTVVHELGHTVGLYHEQARFDQVGLQANNNCAPANKGLWRAVTPRDRDSIMGYRHCDGINKIDQVGFSAGDRQGLSYLYTIPRPGPTRLDDGPTDDIFWVAPNSDTMTAWFGGSNMAGDIVFASETVDTPVVVSRHVKPVPVRVSSAARTDVLLYEPGVKAELMIKREAEAFDVDVLGNAESERHAIPLVGNFLGGSTHDVWWWLAGPARSDDVWEFAENGSFSLNTAYDTSFSADNYARALVGTWNLNAGSGLPDSQVVWYREQDMRTRLLVQNDGMNGPDGDASNASPLCGLPAGGEFRALVGNFDLDAEHEILWVSPNSNAHVMWWDVPALWESGGTCSSANFGTFTFPEAGTRKPFVGDFDNNGVDDIFWYIGGPLPPDPDNPLPPSEVEQVWFMGDRVVLEIEPYLAQGDFSPYVGDFNGDGCEDILWFAPHQDTSPVWRAKCLSQERGFIAQLDEVTHPPLAYPVGYYPTRGRL